MSKRIAVIGSTGKGGYGHGLDTAFVGVEGAVITAVADDNPAGLAAAGKLLKVDTLYADYRQLLETERPDIVCLGTRWLTDRVAMIEAIAAAGCHLYCEKPLVADLVALDAISTACQKHRVKLAMAHQWRAMPPVQLAIAQLKAGKWGRPLRLRARAKDDARGGGEELIVHGTHWFDLMIAIAGRPEWVFGQVTVQGRDATRADVRQGTEPVGPIAGDAISAMFGFPPGVRGGFESTAGVYRGKQSPFGVLYGLQVECEQALLHFCQPGDVYIYPAPTVQPDDPKLTWEKLWVEEWHFTPEHLPRPRGDWLHYGNQVLARDLLQAIDTNREPLSGLPTVGFVTEMIQGVYASHLSGKRLSLPLVERRHPLG